MLFGQLSNMNILCTLILDFRRKSLLLSRYKLVNASRHLTTTPDLKKKQKTTTTTQQKQKQKKSEKKQKQNKTKTKQNKTKHK